MSKIKKIVVGIGAVVCLMIIGSVVWFGTSDDENTDKKPQKTSSKEENESLDNGADKLLNDADYLAQIDDSNDENSEESSKESLAIEDITKEIVEEIFVYEEAVIYGFEVYEDMIIAYGCQYLGEESFPWIGMANMQGDMEMSGSYFNDAGNEDIRVAYIKDDIIYCAGMADDKMVISKMNMYGDVIKYIKTESTNIPKSIEVVEDYYLITVDINETDTVIKVNENGEME